jgi:hypothetical protein
VRCMEGAMQALSVQRNGRGKERGQSGRQKSRTSNAAIVRSRRHLGFVTPEKGLARREVRAHCMEGAMWAGLSSTAEGERKVGGAGGKSQ